MDASVNIHSDSTCGSPIPGEIIRAINSDDSAHLNKGDEISEIESNSNFSSATTEPETEVATDNEDSAAIAGNTLRRPQNHVEKNRKNNEVDADESNVKAYEELLAENGNLRKLLDSKNAHLAKLERNHQVVQDENHLLTLEIRDIQKTADEENMKLEVDLQQSNQINECLQKKVDKLVLGIKELNEMLFEAILQLNSNGNHGRSSSSTAEEATDSNQVALCPIPSQPTPSSTQTESSSAQQPEMFHNFALSSELACQLASIDKLLHQKTSSSTSNKDQSLIERSSGMIPIPKRPETRSSFARRVHRCLESIPPTRNLEKGSPKPPQEKTTTTVAVTKFKKNKKKVKHAIDTKKQQEGFYCICGASLTSKLGLITHIKYHTYPGQFRCTDVNCGRRFFATAALRAHMKAQHGLVYKLGGREGCRRCGQICINRKELYQHCRIVHNCGPLLSVEKRMRKRLSSQPSPATVVKASSGSAPLPTPNKNVSLGNTAITKSQLNVEATETPSIGPIKRGRQQHQQDLSLFRMRHELDTSRPQGQIHCVCGRHFRSQNYLRQHINYFSCEPKFPCKVCGMLYNGLHNLKQHMQCRHNMVLMGVCGCSSCGRVFETRMAYNQHCKKLHNGDTETYLQKICSGSSSSSSPVITANEMKHNKRHRKAPSKYIEESEGLSSVRQANRSISKEMHREDVDCRDGIRCICGNSYSRRSTLLKHVRMKASDSVKCKFCPRKFRYKDNLKKHMNIVHYRHPEADNHIIVSMNSAAAGVIVSSGVNSTRHGLACADAENRVFKCLCGTHFKYLRTLRDHVRLKLGLTQFSCKICNEKFNRFDYLRTHMQRVHKTFLQGGMACRICGIVGFSSINEVKNHRLRFHANEDANQDPLLTLPWE